jgi:hypothetical protein
VTHIDKFLRDLAWWVVWNVSVGKLAPYLFGYAIGSKPVKVDDVVEGREE